MFGCLVAYNNESNEHLDMLTVVAIKQEQHLFSKRHIANPLRNKHPKPKTDACARPPIILAIASKSTALKFNFQAAHS